MEYELWIDGVWQDQFTTHEAAARAITIWLGKHHDYLTTNPHGAKVTFEIRVINCSKS